MNPFRYVRILSLLLLPLSAEIQLVAVDTDEEDAAVVEAPTVVEDHSREKIPEFDRVRWMNGDQLSGELVSASPDHWIWKHPDAEGALRFSPGEVREVSLRGSSNPEPLESLARVELTNGDVFRGQILRMEAGTLHLSTPYAGEVALAASRLRSLRPAAAATVFFEGPGPLADWQGEKNGWREYKGGLIGGNHTTIGRDFPGFPDTAEIEMDVSWRGHPQFQLAFWVDNAENMHQGSFMFMVQGGHVALYHFSPNQENNDLGSFQYEKFQTMTRARLHLRIDRPTRQIGLWVNGELVRQWKATQNKVPRGEGIVLQGTGPGGFRLESLIVRTWDGKVENESANPGGTRDRVELANRDSFSGTLESILDGKMKFVTEFATLEVPVDRVVQIRFAEETRETARRRPEDVRLLLATDEHMTLALEALDAGEIRGTSENCGTLRVDRAWITGLHVNLYDARREIEEEDPW